MDTENRVKVWDLGVRVFHWSLVVLFITAYISGEEESDLHAYAGYCICGLIIFRIIWGFVGGQYARFSDWIYGPGKTLAYLNSIRDGSPAHYMGHNPLAGWMILTLLIFVSAILWSGLNLYGAEGHGPLAGDAYSLVAPALADDEREDDDDEDEDEHHGRGERGDHDEEAEEFWEDIHEALANFTLLLVILHVAGVLIASRIEKENLIKAMITGYKRKRD